MSIVRIYCMAHKKYEKLNNDIYIPLQVGAALHNSLGYHSDNTGDNISERNPYYSELTGLYWLYKNDSDCDITGLCHYRRYFINERNEVLLKEDIEHILNEYDIIVSEPLELESQSLYESYAVKHNKKDMDLTREAVSKLYPDYLDTFDEVMNGSKMYFAPPIDYDKVMKKNPYGKVITVGKIREHFAKLSGADFTEPITAGIFVSIVAWASYQRTEDKTPYWRTLKAKGELNAKYPGGIEAQKEMLEKEGHIVLQKGRTNIKYYVKDYEKALFTL